MDALRLMTGSPSQSYDDIEKLLSCPICLEVFSKPVVILPCQHNLCRQCADDMYQNRGIPMGSGGRFKCPTCRYEVILDRHGVFSLQRNLLVENIIDMYQSDDKKTSLKKSEQFVMCDDHEDERVNIYCTTCQKATCSLCKVFGQHQECEVAPMEKIYHEQKEEISEAIRLLVSENDRLQGIIKKTEELEMKTNANGEKVFENLNEAFDHLHTILEKRKSIMVARVKSDLKERNQVLEALLKNYKQQLDSGSKLMRASLSLVEERSIPQFLALSREMIEKLLEAVASSEGRKPPFNIQNTTEFHINFHFQQEIIDKLDFTPLYAEDDEFQCDGIEDELEDFSKSIRPSLTAGYDVIVEEESDDVTTSSSNSDFDDAKNRKAGTSSGESGDNKANCLNDKEMTNTETEKKNPAKEEAESDIKKGRWYDMFVRQLPSPISMSGFSAPMESSVHMKVVIPPTNQPAEEEEELKKENAAESVASGETDDLDSEIEQLLAPRRRWKSRFAFQSSPELSPRSSPTPYRSYPFSSRDEDFPSPHASPVFLRRRRLRNTSPTSASQSSRTQTSTLLQTSARQRSSSPAEARRHLKNESPVRKHSFSCKKDRQRSKSPGGQASGSSSPPAVGRSRDGRGESGTSESQRPRLYCSHKRRTWSHLLNK